MTALVSRLADRGQTVGTAESLTGGLVSAAITAVPGASAVLRGGVVAYATDLKRVLLGVPADDLARDGAVHERTALAMARGARDRLGATWGVATTGVAGPDPQEGKPPGRVHVAVYGPPGGRTRTLHVDGDRGAVRAAAVAAALDLLAAAVEAESAAAPRS